MLGAGHGADFRGTSSGGVFNRACRSSSVLVSVGGGRGADFCGGLFSGGVWSIARRSSSVLVILGGGHGADFFDGSGGSGNNISPTFVCRSSSVLLVRGAFAQDGGGILVID